MNSFVTSSSSLGPSYFSSTSEEEKEVNKKKKKKKKKAKKLISSFIKSNWQAYEVSKTLSVRGVQFEVCNTWTYSTCATMAAYAPYM